MLINRLRMVKSEMVLNSDCAVVSAVTAIIIICPIIELMGPSCGAMPFGNWMDCNFSAVNWRALYTSVLKSNSTNTNPKPGDATDRTTSTPGEPFKAVSTGKFICDSISSGAMPLASKKIVTLGLFKSGNTSTGRFTSVKIPYTIISAANATTNNLLRSEN